MASTQYVLKGTTNLSGTLTIVTGDTLIFGEGEQTVDTGTDLSALNPGLVDVIIKRAFAGKIVDLTFDSTGLFWYDAGGGSCSIVANGTATEVITKVLHTGKGALTGKTAGTVTLWDQTDGTGYITDTILATTIALSGGTLSQKYNATVNTTWKIYGGQFNTGRGCTTGNIHGGTTVVKREDSSATLPVATTLNVYGPGIIRWWGGSITTLNLLHPDCWFDPSNAPAALTVGTLNGHAKAIRKSGLPIVSGGTVTNAANKLITLTTLGTVDGGKAEFYAGLVGGSPV